MWPLMFEITSQHWCRKMVWVRGPGDNNDPHKYNKFISLQTCFPNSQLRGGGGGGGGGDRCCRDTCMYCAWAKLEIELIALPM